MKRVVAIIYRNLTDADFFNINKPRGSESRGGGQAYIDVPVARVSIEDWKRFFRGVRGLNATVATVGPVWEFPIFSIGVPATQEQSAKIYQRRAQSVSITSQKLDSRRSNRIHAWHPTNGFPFPIDNSQRQQCPDGLMIFLAKTDEGEIWAGWYINDGSTDLPVGDSRTRDVLAGLFERGGAREGESGYLALDQAEILLDATSKDRPFRSVGATGEEGVPIQPAVTTNPVDDEDVLFDEDIRLGSGDRKVNERTIKVRARNRALVESLKKLYRHQCQVTGEKYIFKKKNGEGYTEAHHLIPLGREGDDSPQNLVILCPMLHRMLHFAQVRPINLDEVIYENDGSARLQIFINDTAYEIRWHPRHAEFFKSGT